MEVLVTGKNGFIAKNFIEKSNYKNVTAIGREDLDLLDSEKVREFLKENKFDVIIHCATYDAIPAHYNKDINKMLDYNLRMFFNLIECENYFKKMIYFGSGAEYNRNYWVPKMPEDYFGKHIPEDSYGFGKYIMTKYAENNKKLLNLRLFAVFGEYEDPLVRIISKLCVSALKGETLTINENKCYDFLYIGDLVNIIDWFIVTHPIIKENIFNICSNQIHKFSDIAEYIVKLSGKNLNIKIETEKLDLEYSGDNSRFLDLCDFEFIPINESIKYLFNWYKENYDYKL